MDGVSISHSSESISPRSSMSKYGSDNSVCDNGGSWGYVPRSQHLEKLRDA